MKQLLVLGAGRSSFSLINYLLTHAQTNDWQITVADQNLDLALDKTKNHPRSQSLQFDVTDTQLCEKYVQKSDLVISLLPPNLHYLVAQACVKFKKNFLTASYVSDQIQALDQAAKENGVLILNELGLDPGIDHLSAMQIIEHLNAKNASIEAFRSYTGGLIAPESDNNPWNYKFTWNPRNVVLAGQGTARYIQNGEDKYVPYHRLFADLQPIFMDELGEWEGYPNRNSLSYREVYGLPQIPTLIRGTIRAKNFCKSWDVFVQLGITDDSYSLPNSEKLTYRQFINAYLPYSEILSVEQKLAKLLGVHQNDTLIEKIAWLGLFENQEIGLKNATPAQILQKKLEEKWFLEEHDKDIILMQHIFDYQENTIKKRLFSSLVVRGKSQQETAMAMTVGLPLAIGAKLVLEGKINKIGVCLPIYSEIYEPILAELASIGIAFVEKEVLR